MEERKLMFIALLFIAAVSVVGLVSMMKTSSTGHAAAWGNVYADSSSYRNCYCNNGEYAYAWPRNPFSAIYGRDVRFIGQRTENQCMHECREAGYTDYFWVNPDAIQNPVWPRRDW